MIGFFDSGLGGLTVLAKALDGGAGGRMVYLGDKRNAPYGLKSEEELLQIVKNNVGKLKDVGCDRFVCACNTASLIAKANDLDVPCFFLRTREYLTPRSLFLGTRRSVEILSKENFLDVRFHALSRLATMIDERVEKEAILEYLRAELGDIRGVDKVILGCTHYGFLKDEICRVLRVSSVVEVASSVLNADIYYEKKPAEVYFPQAEFQEYSKALKRLTKSSFESHIIDA